jgi:DNA-binding response OmpR family regulator
MTDAEPSQTRVLVVSDDPLVREEARYGFPSGFVVSFAIDSRDALTQLEEQTPSVVVADLQTGNAGGYALARDMAQSARLARIPVLMLLQREQDEWLARSAGATAFCTKPLGAGRLARRVLALTSTAPA